MVILIMLYWIGQQLFAPTWYWLLWGFVAFSKVIDYGMTCYKKGAKK